MASADHVPLMVGGRAALARLGSRVYLIYACAAVVGIALLAAQEREPGGPSRSSTSSLAVGIVAAVIALLFVARRLEGLGDVVASEATRIRRGYLFATVVLAQLVLLASVRLALPPLGWPTRSILSWVTGGFAVGAALAGGPWWGAGALLLLDLAYLGIWAGSGTSFDVGLLVDTPVSVAVGCVVHFGASRGFARTQRAAVAAQEAEAARLRAERELTARRVLDRQLHDTLLSTLTLVAHRAPGAPAEKVAELCRRDHDALVADRWGLGEGPVRSSDPVAADAGDDSAARLRDLVDLVCAEASLRGLEVRAHLVCSTASTPGSTPLPEGLEAAWLGAVSECLGNVSRHAQVAAADLVVDLSQGELRTVVLDEGCGFVPSTIGNERLGLASSVVDRIAGLGGAVRVWSEPGRGTMIELSLPLGPP